MRTSAWVLFIVMCFSRAVSEETSRKILRTVPIQVGEENINVNLYEGDVIRDVAEKFLKERGIGEENLEVLIQLLSPKDTPQQEEEVSVEKETTKQEEESTKQEEVSTEQEEESTKQEETSETEKNNLRQTAKDEEKMDESPVQISADDSAFYKKFAALPSVTCLENGVCYRKLKTYDVYDKIKTKLCNFQYEVWNPSAYPNEKPIEYATFESGFWVNTKLKSGRKSKWDVKYPFIKEVSLVMELGEEFEIVAPTSLITNDQVLKKIDDENVSEVIFRIHKSSCDKRSFKVYARSGPGKLHPKRRTLAYLGGGRHEEL